MLLSSLSRTGRTIATATSSSSSTSCLSRISSRYGRGGVAVVATRFEQSFQVQVGQRTITTRFNLPDHSNRIHPALTKVVATIGPTSEQEVPIQKVVHSGMDIMRLNFSHATPEEVQLRCTNLYKALQTLSVNNSNSSRVVGILLDTKGPEIRTGKLQNDTTGHDTITLEQGSTIIVRTDDAGRDAGSTVKELYIDYPYLSQAVKVGNHILLDDGACTLTVDGTDNVKYGSVQCTIQNTASLRSRAGVNLPLADTSDYLPALSDKDKGDILYGMGSSVDIDFIAASFVQSGAGVRDIRAYVEECAQKLGYADSQPRPLIISKIETASALQNYDEILKESDSIMVARGDLGVEIPLQQVTNAQKEMIAACNAVGKPCIVATQMLESMTKSPRPTRAEVSDVTNAVHDGADAVMTSGETAKGKYPSETIAFMQSILISAEEFLAENVCETHMHCSTEIPNSPVAVVATSTVFAANRTPDCQAIMVLDAVAPGRTGSQDDNTSNNLTTLVAAFRPFQVPIIAVCTNTKTARQLLLYRGVRPLVVTSPQQRTDNVDDCAELLKLAKEQYQLESGKPIIIVSSNATRNSTGTNASGGSSSMKITLLP